MSWVTMTRKASQGTWRMYQRNAYAHVPPEEARVEVVTIRTEDNQAEEARRILRRMERLGFLPAERVEGARYTIPLTLSLGCEKCGERHIDACLTTTEETP